MMMMMMSLHVCMVMNLYIVLVLLTAYNTVWCMCCWWAHDVWYRV